jgi:DNA polymerase-3 subunit beta
MKVLCDRGALLDAINLISGVVANRSPRPQLKCVKLTATKDGQAGQLMLEATDAELSMTLLTERVDVEQPGEALIPADKLAQIVRAEENEPTLTLEVDGDTTHIRGADAHFQLRGFEAKDFPEIPGFVAIAKDTAAFTIKAGALVDLVRRTLFAAARENSRYAINGVLVRRDGKKLEFVATDGRRLALCRGTLESEGDAMTCIVPSKALVTLTKLIDDPDEQVAVSISDNRIAFGFSAGDGTGRALIASNLVEGSFPPYEDVIPKGHDIKVGFDRDVLSSAVKRAALLTNEESRGVRLAFSSGDKKLELSSRVPEMGEARIEVDLMSMDGDDLEIGFNPGFITDALRVIDDPQVMLELKAPNKPGLLRSGGDFVYVVMPVNLQ